jgi:hypothetical protein
VRKLEYGVDVQLSEILGSKSMVQMCGETKSQRLKPRD